MIMKEAISIAEKHWASLHGMPESAFGEFRTTEYIKEACKQYPVTEIDTGMETGAVYYLDAGAKETVALRTDIDAVPTEKGPQHLCGHDGHAATMLGAMHYLCAQSGLPYNVLFIFQPAEEGTRGAKAMIGHGLLDKVSQRPVRIFGIHNRPEVPVGDIVVHKGPLMSEKSIFTITYTGRSGHASLPHKCIDPLIASAAFVSGVQTVISRNTDPFKPAICTVNSLKAGDPAVPAPETAVMTGYIRSFDHASHERMEKRLIRLAESTAEAYECRCSIDLTHAVPAVDNSEEMHAVALRAARTALEMAATGGHVVDSDPCLASEDFAVWGTEMPAFFYWVGSGTPGKDNAPWHDPGFCMDPDYLKTAVPVLCASALTE